MEVMTCVSMHHTFVARLLLLGFGAFQEPSLGASAETAPPDAPVWSLAEVKRTAFQRNWDLLAAKSDVDAATAQRIVSKECPNPTVGLTTAKISIDDHPSSTASGNS